MTTMVLLRHGQSAWNEEGDLPHTEPLKDKVTPKGVEGEEDIAGRKGLSRQIGYKL